MEGECVDIAQHASVMARNFKSSSHECNHTSEQQSFELQVTRNNIHAVYAVKCDNLQSNRDFAYSACVP